MDAPLRFQHFEVLTRPDGTPHVLGKGAMGVTYKAFDTNLHKMVVIKVINPSFLAEPTARQRFLQEAQAMAQVRHPNVADVFHFGESPTGLFYAMEFCDGPTLDEYVRQTQPLNANNALALCKQAAGALQALESAELIHRDIKPSNLILARDVQGATQIKLIDFGLARGDAETEIDPDLTQGGFVGTPSYASPEQLLEQEGLDIRSDIYSLGGSLWFALTGAAMFKGSQVEVMFHHVNSPPPWDELPPLSKPVRQILESMLKKSRDERFATAAELWDAIDDCLRQEAAGEMSTVRLAPLAAGEHKGSILGQSNYEILAEIGEDRQNVIYRGRDVVRGRVVRLCYLNKEFTSDAARLNRMRSEAARLKTLPHPNQVAILDFLTGSEGAQLVSEWVSGASLLNALKARERIPLAELAPLASQLAAGFDHAVRHHMHRLETELHQITIQFSESKSDETSPSALVREPVPEWGGFTVKLMPLGLGGETGSDDPEVIQRRIFGEFLQLIHRLLGGVSGSQTRAFDYSTVPFLSAEANEVLEGHVMAKQLPGAAPCRLALGELLKTEKVDFDLGPEPEEPAAKEKSPPGADADADLTVIADVDGPMDWTGGMPASWTDGTSGSQGSSADYRLKRLELEHQRRQLEAEAERLEAQEQIEAERGMLAQERALLEQERDQLRRRESQRAKAADEERKKLETERQRLEESSAELQSKRQEQERLAQELNLRSQLEFQKLQEEREKLESEWQKRSQATEKLLREKEEQFLLREQESLKRIRQEREELEQVGQELEERGRTQVQEEQSKLESERTELQEQRKELEEQLAKADQELLNAREELQARTDSFEERRKALEEEKQRLAEKTHAPGTEAEELPRTRGGAGKRVAEAGGSQATRPQRPGDGRGRRAPQIARNPQRFGRKSGAIRRSGQGIPGQSPPGAGSDRSRAARVEGAQRKAGRRAPKAARRAGNRKTAPALRGPKTAREGGKGASRGNGKTGPGIRQGGGRSAAAPPAVAGGNCRSGGQIERRAREGLHQGAGPRSRFARSLGSGRNSRPAH